MAESKKDMEATKHVLSDSNHGVFGAEHLGSFNYQPKMYPHRKKRKPLTEAKRLRLEDAFARKEVPRGRLGSAAKARLAKELELTVKEVHKWFDNRRTKENLLEKRLFAQMLGGGSKDGSSGSKKESLGGSNSRKRRKWGSTLCALSSGKGNDLDTPVDASVAQQFRLVNRYFEGALDLNESSPADDSGMQSPSGLGFNTAASPSSSISLHLHSSAAGHHGLGLALTLDPSHVRRRKTGVVPTLQNVVETAFAKDSCFSPLIEAVETISSRGFLEGLIRRVLHEPPSLRTFLMWYVIGKHSGDRTIDSVIRSFMSGLSPCVPRTSVSEVIEAQIPELLDGGVSTEGHAGPQVLEGKYNLFTADSRDGSSLSNDQTVKWMREFLYKMFVGRKIIHRKREIMAVTATEEDIMVTGEITKVLHPSARRPNDPRFRVFYVDLDIATTLPWSLVRKTIEPRGSM